MVSKRNERRTRSSVSRTIAATLAMAAIVAACGGTDYGSGVKKDVGTKIDVGKGLDTKPGKKKSSKKDPAPSPTPSTRGTILIKVVDQTGEGRMGVLVRFISPLRSQTAEIVTDGKGFARATASPGNWRVEIPTGCHASSFVTFGGVAEKVGVVSSQVTRGTLRMEGVYRYVPGPPVQYQKQPPWALDDDVRVHYRLRDRCDHQLAPNVDFRRGFYLSPTGSLTSIEYTTKSDAQGIAWADLRCTDPGGARLWAIDEVDTNERIDVLRITPPANPGANWCAHH